MFPLACLYQIIKKYQSKVPYIFCARKITIKIEDTFWNWRTTMEKYLAVFKDWTPPSKERALGFPFLIYQ